MTGYFYYHFFINIVLLYSDFKCIVQSPNYKQINFFQIKSLVLLRFNSQGCVIVIKDLPLGLRVFNLEVVQN